MSSVTTSCWMTLAADRVPHCGHRLRAVWLLALVFMLQACTPGPEVWRFKGPVMGTSFHVTIVSPPAALERTAVQNGVAAALVEVDREMSTFKADSDVSRFNRAAPGEWVAVSPGTAAVVAKALEVHALSGGAFDITVSPLVDLWGFGAGSHASARLPTDDEIASATAHVGSKELGVRLDEPALIKHAERQIDLSAIAKGYGVDRAAQWLQAQGIDNYMVEVGGEVRAAGRNPTGHAWRIGIEAPGTANDTVITAVALRDKAVATSGDYRNYFERDGKRYSHTIDPATGRPISHDLASVTVIADDCMSADAFATAIDVLGPEKGLELAERQGLPVYLLIRVGDGFEAHHNSAFEPFLDADTGGSQ